jgi:hypothetical protein
MTGSRIDYIVSRYHEKAISYEIAYSMLRPIVYRLNKKEAKRHGGYGKIFSVDRMLGK